MDKIYQDKIDELRAEKAECAEALETLEALNAFSRTRGFTRFIKKGYFEDNAIRLVMAKADPAMQNHDAQVSITKEIDAIGLLRQHFHSITCSGRSAENKMGMIDESIKELIEESAQEEASISAMNSLDDEA